jgi:hypothetical protein
MFSTDPGTRQAFITGLRQLADYLEANPVLPVPPFSTDINVQADSTETGGRTQVDVIAEQLGVPVQDETAEVGHYSAERDFGPVTYCAISISDARMALHRALHSYFGHVTPEAENADA